MNRFTQGAAQVEAYGADAAWPDAPERLARLRTFHSLDALRGVAALAIVLFHAGFIYGLAPPAEGQLAVDLFFVMNGFIIAHRYGEDLADGMRLSHFLKLRLIRLYPLFLLGMVLGVAPALLAVLTAHRDPLHVGLLESFPLALLMLPSRLALPNIQEIYPLNYVAWSLALELVVNVAYAATARFWTIPRLAVLLAAAFVGLCVCAFVFGDVRGGYDWSNAPVGLVRVLYGFGAGVLLCRLGTREPFRMRVPWWLLLGIACAIFIVPHPVARPIWEIFAICVLMPSIVAAATANEPPVGLRAPCALAGIYSYAVYSLHAPFVGFFLRGESRANLDIHTQTHSEALIFTGLLGLACVLAHLCYDRPVRRYLSVRLVAGIRKRPSPTPILVPSR